VHSHDVVDLRPRDLSAQLLHGQVDLTFADEAIGVRVELVEGDPETRIREEGLRVNGGSKELRVVDHSVAVDVNLSDQFSNLVAAELNLILRQHGLQLDRTNQA